MRKNSNKSICIAVALLAAFGLWTVLLRCIDVRPIGPNGSTVGLASLNAFMHKLIGVHMNLYLITDWLSLVPIAVVAGFSVLGLVQWIKRKSLRKVDYSILILGGFYAVVMAAFLLFEKLVVNYRPVLIEGVLEASYPSSTTMLVMCVMPTAILQLNQRIQKTSLKRCIGWSIAAFTVFMVVSRWISGVHWFSDIIGGMLLSTGLVTLYYGMSRIK